MAQSIRNIVMNTVAILRWEKEQTAVTNEQRKDNYHVLFSDMRETQASESDIVNAANLLGVEMKRAGQKDSSIKVKRSEFRRIWENIAHVPEDCSGWKKALTAIRVATTSEQEILRQDIAKVQEQILALQDKLANLQQELSAIDNPIEEEVITFSDEQVNLDMRKAA